MRIHLFGLVYVVRAQYDWIQPKELREKFLREVDYAPIPVESRDSFFDPVLMVSIDESNPDFRGSNERKSHFFLEFSDAYNLFVPFPGNCIGVLDLWVYRPDWFVPRKENVESAQECLNTLLESIPTDLEDNGSIESGVILVDLLTSVIPVIRSAEAEYIKSAEFGEEWRRAWEKIPPFPETPGFIRSLSSCPVLSSLVSNMLPDQEDQEEVVSSGFFKSGSVEGRYWKALVESDFQDSSLSIHFPSFFDHVMTRRGELRETTARAVKYILTNEKLLSLLLFDELDMMDLLSRPGITFQPEFVFGNQVLKYCFRSEESFAAEKWTEVTSVVNLLDGVSGTNFGYSCLPWGNADFSDSVDYELNLLDETREHLLENWESLGYVILASLVRAGRGKLGIDTVNYLECILNAVTNANLRVDLVPEESRIEMTLSLIYLARATYGAPARLMRGFDRSSFDEEDSSLEPRSPGELVDMQIYPRVVGESPLLELKSPQQDPEYAFSDISDDGEEVPDIGAFEDSPLLEYDRGYNEYRLVPSEDFAASDSDGEAIIERGLRFFLFEGFDDDPDSEEESSSLEGHVFV